MHIHKETMVYLNMAIYLILYMDLTVLLYESCNIILCMYVCIQGCTHAHSQDLSINLFEL